jgi:hypothetical protein
MMRRVLPGCFALLAVVLSACSDTPTTPAVENEGPQFSKLGSTPRGVARTVAVVCDYRRPLAGSVHGWEVRRVRLRLPLRTATATGRTLRYTYRMETAEGQVRRFANCPIPATGAAIRWMDEFVGATRPGARRTVIGGPEAESVLRGCVRDGLCEIEGIEATVPGTSDPDCMYKYTGSCEDPFSTPSTPEEDHLPGGGGDDGTSAPSEQSCEASRDTTCLQPLTRADSATILKALRDHLRPDSAIADTTARRECAEMRRQFEESFATGNVFRGAYNNPDSTAHFGTTFGEKIHMDPWLLDGANGGDLGLIREVAITALHESAHVMKLGHPNGFTMVNGRDVYTDPYYNRLSPGPNSCNKF